jgi:hypothetical protein
LSIRSSIVGAVILATLLTATPVLADDGPIAPLTGRDILLSGLYSDQWHAGADLQALGAASGKGVSLAGTFHHLWESENGWEGNTDWLLEQAWSAQATPVANVEVMMPAAEIAAGVYDMAIIQWAMRVKAWLERGEGRSLLIAPLQEMNGDWVPYGMDPEGFKASYRRFIEIFESVRIDDTRVRWVFAPNAWSVWPYRTSDYYPGDDVVDFVGISAYNFGSTAGRWTNVVDSGLGALNEIRSFAPNKPYLITQVGSSSSGGDRDAWLRDLFQVAAADPNVVGLIYFNFLKETDWKLWDGANLSGGWHDGMQMPATVHIWPLVEWFQPGPIPFAPYQGRFADDDSLLGQSDIEWLADRGVIQGCSIDQYCPGNWVTREQLATFLARGLALPAPSVDHFVDDNGSPHEADINALAEAGITAGCAAGLFCPADLLSRQQLAGLLAQALDLPPADPVSFADVVESPNAAHINSLVAAGISMGCSVDQFCPWAAVNREQMASFLRRSLERALAEARKTPSWGSAGPWPF